MSDIALAPAFIVTQHEVPVQRADFPHEDGAVHTVQLINNYQRA